MSFKSCEIPCLQKGENLQAPQIVLNSSLNSMPMNCMRGLHKGGLGVKTHHEPNGNPCPL